MKRFPKFFAVSLSFALLGLVHCGRSRDFKNEDSGGGGGQGGAGPVTDGGSADGGSTPVPLGELGAKCSVDAECDGGVCADGVCCESECGECNACSEKLTGEPDGTCAPVSGAGQDPHKACDLGCNGSGACQVDSGEVCSSDADCGRGRCTAEGTCEICEEATDGYWACNAWPYPVGDDLYAVSVRSENEFLAVGAEGSVLKYLEQDNQPSWTFFRLPGKEKLEHVCEGNGSYFIASSSSIWVGDGTEFTEDTEAPQGVLGLACSAEGVLFAGGNGFLMKRSASGSWSNVVASPGLIVDLWLSDANELYALERAASSGDSSTIIPVTSSGSVLAKIAVPSQVADGTAAKRIAGRGATLAVSEDYGEKQPVQYYEDGEWTPIPSVSHSAMSPCSAGHDDLLFGSTAARLVIAGSSGCYGRWGWLSTAELSGASPSLATDDAIALGGFFPYGLGQVTDGKAQVFVAVGARGQIARKRGTAAWELIARSPAPEQQYYVSAAADAEPGLLVASYYDFYIGNNAIQTFTWVEDAGVNLSGSEPTRYEIVSHYVDGEDYYRIYDLATSGPSGVTTNSAVQILDENLVWQQVVALDGQAVSPIWTPETLLLILDGLAYEISLPDGDLNEIPFASSAEELTALGSGGLGTFAGSADGYVLHLEDGSWVQETSASPPLGKVQALLVEETTAYAAIGEELWVRDGDMWKVLHGGLPATGGGSSVWRSDEGELVWVHSTQLSALKFSGDSFDDELAIALPFSFAPKRAMPTMDKNSVFLAGNTRLVRLVRD